MSSHPNTYYYLEGYYYTFNASGGFVGEEGAPAVRYDLNELFEKFDLPWLFNYFTPPPQFHPSNKIFLHMNFRTPGHVSTTLGYCNIRSTDAARK